MVDLLPIGSIVKLKDNKIRMIMGYLPISTDNKIYDYLCCNYLRGFRKKKEELEENLDYFYANKEDIDSILYIGYDDFNFTLYKKVVKVDKESYLESNKKASDNNG